MLGQPNIPHKQRKVEKMEILVEELSLKLEYMFRHVAKDIVNRDIDGVTIVLNNVESVAIHEKGVTLTVKDDGFNRPIFIEKQDFLSIKIM